MLDRLPEVPLGSCNFNSEKTTCLQKKAFLYIDGLFPPPLVLYILQYCLTKASTVGQDIHSLLRLSEEITELSIIHAFWCGKHLSKRDAAYLRIQCFCFPEMHFCKQHMLNSSDLTE